MLILTSRMSVGLVALVALSWLPRGAGAAEEPGLSDPDFLVQGEYTGELTLPEGKQKLGVADCWAG